MRLPYVITKLPDLSLLQSRWKGIIDTLLDNPSLSSNILNDVALINGTTVVNHRLGRKLQGWRIIGINAAATIYDNQANNQTPDLTLTLISNAAVTAQIEVF